MLASKFQARWRTCPPIFGHSEFCERRISRLLFRHDSIVIAYTRIFCKVPSSAWSSKKETKNYLPPTENTRRGELNHVIFVSTKVIIAWQKVLASLVFLARLRFTSSEKMMCASWCTDFYSRRLIKSTYKIWWHNEPAFFRHYECIINNLVTLPFYSIFVLHWGAINTNVTIVVKQRRTTCWPTHPAGIAPIKWLAINTIWIFY